MPTPYSQHYKIYPDFIIEHCFCRFQIGVDIGKVEDEILMLNMSEIYVAIQYYSGYF